MNWLSRLTRPAPGTAARLPHARPVAANLLGDDIAALLAVGFVCSDCGRTDLPETGGWDPPICQECDAAINADVMAIADSHDNHDADDHDDAF